jgi:hypothetical protein
MRHKLDTAIYAQGWIEGQLEAVVQNTLLMENEDPTGHLVATQLLEQWAVFSQTFDDVVDELREANRKLAIVRSAGI